MSTRLRLFLAFLLVLVTGLGLVLRWVSSDLRPQPLKAVEESLADTAAILAGLVESKVQAGVIDVTQLRSALDIATRRELDAQIYELHKTSVLLRVYVTNHRGRVIYDSDGGRAEGEAYAGWNDVARTLKGAYGARATRSNLNDFFSTVLYVAAPIRSDNRVIGVLSVGKPVASIKLFISNASRDILMAGGIALVVVGVLSLLLATWITAPIKRLTAYAAAVGEGQRPPLPPLGSSEIGHLGKAFEGMRDALEGKHYIEGYVRTLTHEIKGPLTAIRAAAELLEEDMSGADRARFVGNIRAESTRLQLIVDRMLELSRIEVCKRLERVETVDLNAVAEDVLASVRPVAEQRAIALAVDRARLPGLCGDRFLIRQALHNLVQNALDFTPQGGSVTLRLETEAHHVKVSVLDTGPGVPGYALQRVFDRFYTIPPPGSAATRTGLGLAFVREVALLHDGDATLHNRPEGGAEATLRLGVAKARSNRSPARRLRRARLRNASPSSPDEASARS